MKDIRPKIKNVVGFVITVILFAVVIMVVCLLMLKYSIEGEENMPFELSQLIVISTAEGLDKEEGENRWNFDLVQNNDVYLYISKNKSYKETAIIKNITLNNFEIKDGPNKGSISMYMPSKASEKLYEYSSEYIFENEVTYTGVEKAEAKNLEIPNQGGVVTIRFCSKDIRRTFIK